MTDALPLFERALTVTQADPALTDLRLLLRSTRPSRSATSTAMRRPRGRPPGSAARDRAGTVIRLGQAHSALGQLFFDMGRWDDALAEVEILHEDLKEPAAACCDHGVAAVIRFHRGEIVAARRHLAAAAPHAERIGNRVVGPLALARSLDAEQTGALPAAASRADRRFTGNAEDLEEIEDLLADAVRLATTIGDLGRREDPRRPCHGPRRRIGDPAPAGERALLQRLLDHDAARLLSAAERYRDATRPLLSRRHWRPPLRPMSMTATGTRPGRVSPGRGDLTPCSVRPATSPSCRPGSARMHPSRPRAKHRQARCGWDSLTPTETKIAASWWRGCPTRRSRPDVPVRRTVATHVSHILKSSTSIRG